MNTRVFKATVSCPIADFEVAVLSTEHDAKSDIRSAFTAQFHMSIHMTEVKDIQKSSRRILSNMSPMKKTQTSNEKEGYWAFFRRVS